MASELKPSPSSPTGGGAASEPGPFDVLPAEIEGRLAIWLTLGKELHPLTVNLVVRFARALAAKLADAEKKYGYSDGWRSPDWMDECRQHLLDHIAKGDPRDVAAYCAFLWHHGESTAIASGPSPSDGQESGGGKAPTREALASLLAALHYGQYNTADDEKSLRRNIELALRNFDIGTSEFAASPSVSESSPPVASQKEEKGG